MINIGAPFIIEMIKAEAEKQIINELSLMKSWKIRKANAKVIATSPSLESMPSPILYNRCINITKNPIGIAD